MIDIRDVSKRFGRLSVFEHLTLAVRPGRVTALVGPNGSGKTTLMKMVLGLVRPDCGHVRVGGCVVNGSGAYRARIGYMPQTPCFPDNLTGAEVLALVSSLRGEPARRPQIDDALVESFGLTNLLGRPVRTLSAGTRQKLSAALAFRYRPIVLVLDEPTAGLDPVAARALKDAIHRACADGATILVASHVMAELEELADDVVFLLDGRPQFVGPIPELLKRTNAQTLELAIVRAMTRPQPVGEVA